MLKYLKKKSKFICKLRNIFHDIRYDKDTKHFEQMLLNRHLNFAKGIKRFSAIMFD